MQTISEMAAQRAREDRRERRYHIAGRWLDGLTAALVVVAMAWVGHMGVHAANEMRAALREAGPEGAG